MKRLIVILMIMMGCALAQNTPTVGVFPDNGPNLPATCIIGQVYFRTATTIGLNQCNPANTWTALVAGSGGLPSGLSFSIPTLTISSAGNGNGQLCLSGNTSGTACLTAPAIAGTTTNAVVSTNTVQAPAFSVNGTQTIDDNTAQAFGTAGIHVSSAIFSLARAGAASMGVSDTTHAFGNSGFDFYMTDQQNKLGGFSIGTLADTSSGTGGAGIPYKVDTANDNSIAPTTTTDTGAGIVIGVGVAVCPAGVAKFCPFTATGVQTMTMGTGTCSRGQFVIVDTTTNGDVKCTGTYTAGTVIGVALTAQAVVGSTLNVLVGLR